MSLLGETLDTLEIVELVFVAGQARQKADELGSSHWAKVWRAIGLECEEAIIRRAGG